MNPLPEAALPVVREIRKHVKRPLHTRFRETGNLRGPKLRMNPRKIDKMEHDSKLCCPMGLLPYSINPAPQLDTGFSIRKFNSTQIFQFAIWWDQIPKKDAKAAVDAVWGPK